MEDKRRIAPVQVAWFLTLACAYAVVHGRASIFTDADGVAASALYMIPTIPTLAVGDVLFESRSVEESDRTFYRDRGRVHWDIACGLGGIAVASCCFGSRKIRRWSAAERMVMYIYSCFLGVLSSGLISWGILRWVIQEKWALA
jgi:hypothetical protein